MAKAGNVMRLSGMNSGLDTEAIVNAMSASTKLRITTNQRKVLKLQAQQEAYRGIIDKFNAIKKKYFNITSSNSLTSVTNLNRFKADVTASGSTTEKDLAGVSVTANSSAKAGNYSATVIAAAQQAKIKSAPVNAGQTFNLSECTDSEKEYTFSVTSGSKTEFVTFNGGNTEDVVNQINDQLKSYFGTANDGESGMVSLKASETGGVYSLNAADKSALTTSNILKLDDSIKLESNFATGSNSLSVVINGEIKNIKFSTVENGYFDDIFAQAGEPTDKDGFVFGADPEKVSLFKQVALDMYNTKRHETYEAWKGSDGADYKDIEDVESWNDLSVKQKALFNADVERKNNERRESYYDKAINSIYKEYEKESKADGKKLNTNSDTFDETTNYKSFDDFKADLERDGFTLENFTDNTFKEPAEGETVSEGMQTLKDSKYFEKFSTQFDDYVAGRTEEEDKENYFKLSYNEEEAFNKNYYNEEGFSTDGAISGLVGDREYITSDDYVKNAVNTISADEAVTVFNKNAVKVNLENIRFSDGTKLDVTVNYLNDDESTNVITGFEVNAYKEVKNDDGTKSKEDVNFNIVAGKTASEFELDTQKTAAGVIGTSSKISEMGLTPDEEGFYNFKINGYNFAFSGDNTVKDMMNAVNASDAGVKLSFSSLTNTFELSSVKHGMDAKLEITDGDQGLLSAMGFRSGSTAQGKNMQLEISVNGETAQIETSSNSYQIDGVTFTIGADVKAGTSFDVEVKRDTSAAKELIKSFMNDYNELISHVFGMVDEKPNKDYHFLTDDDKTEMELSDSQIEMWEKASKKGLLYNDSTVKDAMSRLRNALMGSVKGADGNNFGLYSMGLVTSSDFGEHGKLVFYNNDESFFDAALESNFEDIVKLFTDTENGIMQKFSQEIENSVKTTGKRYEKGTLIQKAGLATGTSATDNVINDQIKSLKSMISSLEERYEKQQDRYWKIFGALETQMGALNSQTSSINQMLGM